MSIKKVVAFTGIRSDYDLLSGLYKEMSLDGSFDIRLIVSGSHLSQKQGYTIQEIEKDEIPILARIENLIDSNSTSGRVKSLSILLQSSIHTIVDFNPDLLIVAGDREEVPVGALIGSYLKIPVAHFFGGDHAKDGHVDNPIRHATSKLANIHFTSNQYSADRLKKMGENERRIFNIGSPSLDKFRLTPHISMDNLMAEFHLTGVTKFALLIFHPMVGEEEKSGDYFKKILEVLKERNIHTFVSYPNTDSGFVNIIEVIEKYQSNPNFTFFRNLPRDIFINLFRHTDFLIGNSSAGLYEAPFLKKPVVNVGNRQKGRLAAENVIFVGNEKQDIENAIDELNSNEYREKISKVTSVYGAGDSVAKAMEILNTNEYKDYLFKTEDPLED